MSYSHLWARSESRSSYSKKIILAVRHHMPQLNLQQSQRGEEHVGRTEGVTGTAATVTDGRKKNAQQRLHRQQKSHTIRMCGAKH